MDFSQSPTLDTSLLATSQSGLNLPFGSSDPLQDPLMLQGHAAQVDGSNSAFLVPVDAPQPITFTVTSTADTVDPNDGVLTLREAIAAANAQDDFNIINFNLGAGAQTITLSGKQLAISNPVTIDGQGKLTISGNNRSRIFEVTGSSVTLSGLTIANGSEFRAGGVLNSGSLTLVNSTIRNSTAAVGGAITNEGTLTVKNSTLNNNTASTSAGGIDNHGTLRVMNSTFSANAAGLDGGGIWNYQGSVAIQNSTFTLNTADSDNDGLGNGGGISNTAGTITIESTIIAGNFDTPNNQGIGSIQPDVAGIFVDRGHNLIGNSTGSTSFTVSTLVGSAVNPIDPKLSPLRDHGGFTKTHVPLAESRAIDAGSYITSFFDQRGIYRIGTPEQPIRPDIGAVEALPNLTVDLLTDEDDGNLSPGDVSLREAIRYTTSGGSVGFASGLQGTITLNLGELFIDKTLTITGPGATALTVSGNNQSRVFSLDSTAIVTLTGLTIANGYTQDSGAGIYNSGNLTIANSIIRNNTAAPQYVGYGYTNNAGGGVFNNGTLILANSTLRDNTAGGGSAIANAKGSTMTITNSTIHNNTSTSRYLNYSLTSDAAITNLGTLTITDSTVSHNQAMAGVFNNGTLTLNYSTVTDTINGTGVYNGHFSGVAGVARVGNSIIAGNAQSDVGGAFVSQGYNLIGSGDGSYDSDPSVKTFINGRNGDQVGMGVFRIDPRLGPLQDNGGPTWTHALLPDSPALNAANPNDKVAIDQRGLSRLANSRPDIGAYEDAAPVAVNDRARVRSGGSITIPVLANDRDLDGDRVSIVSYTNPSNGSLVQNPDGSFTYWNRYNAFFPVNDRFTYTISDGKGETSTATVAIDVTWI